MAAPRSRRRRRTAMRYAMVEASRRARPADSQPAAEASRRLTQPSRLLYTSPSTGSSCTASTGVACSSSRSARSRRPALVGDHADLDQHDDMREVGQAQSRATGSRVVGLELIGRTHQLGSGRLLQAPAEAERAEARRCILAVRVRSRLRLHGVLPARPSRSPRAAGCGRRWDRRRAAALPCAWASCRHGAPARAGTSTGGA